MAENIEVGVNVVTGESVPNLEKVRDASAEAGEAVDRLDSMFADVEVSAAEADAATLALEDVTAAAQTADAQTVTVEVTAPDVGPTMSSLDRVKTAGGDTSNVMGNLTGNAAQDLADVTGASATTTGALGQLAEKAFDGGVHLRNLVGAGLGIAAVGAAVEFVTTMLNVMKDADAFDTEKVNDYRDAILEGKDAVTALVEELSKTKTITYQATGETGLASLPWGDSSIIEDITDDVADLGLTVEEYGDLAGGAADDIMKWGEAQRDAGKDAGQVQRVR